MRITYPNRCAALDGVRTTNGGDMVMNLDQYCRVRYGLEKDEKPTKSQRNTVSRMCRDGTLDAVKSGRKWIINERRL